MTTIEAIAPRLLGIGIDDFGICGLLHVDPVNVNFETSALSSTSRVLLGMPALVLVPSLREFWSPRGSSSEGRQVA